MATETPRIIVIANTGDLNVRLYKTEGETEVFIPADGKRLTGRALASFKVSRKVLIENSDEFKTMLGGHVTNARQAIIDIQTGTVTSLELWFRVLHDAVTEDMSAIPINEIWEAIEVSESHEFHIKKLNV